MRRLNGQKDGVLASRPRRNRREGRSTRLAQLVRNWTPEDILYRLAIKRAHRSRIDGTDN